MAGVVLSLSQIVSRASRSLLPLYKSNTEARYFSNVKNTPSPSGTVDAIEISDSCVARLLELGNNATLRVGVDGGGCSGFQYTFELDSPPEEGDHIFQKDGAKVIVDESSLQYLRGATIEFHQELIRSSFRVINNPLAEQGCSCGASFNIKIPK